MRDSRSSRTAQEKLARVREIQAAVGRHLRAAYDCTAPIPDRFADLIQRLERAIDKEKSNPQDSSIAQ